MKENPRLAVVDGLRAMAMLMVFTFHTWEFANKPQHFIHLGSRSFDVMRLAPVGAQGVDLFIVLSGFCLFFPLCFDRERARNFNWKQYALRRVRRIVPSYYAAILYMLGIKVFFKAVRHFTGKHIGDLTWPSPFDLLTHLTFTHTLFPSTFFGITGAFWSLGLEAQFYVLFPLVMWAYNRVGARAIGGLVAVSVCYHVGLQFFGLGFEAGLTGDRLLKALVANNFFLGRWIEFGAGMIVALLVSSHMRRGTKRPLWANILLVLLGLSAFITPVPQWGSYVNPMLLFDLHRGTLIGLLVYAVCTSPSGATFVWSNRVSAFLGFISYSFFLIHQPTMQYLSQLSLHFRPHTSPSLLFAVLMGTGFVLCLAISYTFFLVFEKPFLKSWPLALTRKQRDRKVAVSSEGS